MESHFYYYGGSNAQTLRFLICAESRVGVEQNNDFILWKHKKLFQGFYFMFIFLMVLIGAKELVLKIVRITEEIGREVEVLVLK